jgi:hypothetical protein
MKEKGKYYTLDELKKITDMPKSSIKRLLMRCGIKLETREGKICVDAKAIKETFSRPRKRTSVRRSALRKKAKKKP